METSPGRSAPASLMLDLVRGEEASRQLGALLNGSFPVPAGRRFFDDFPFWDPLLGPGAGRAERFGAWADQQLVASAGVRLARLKRGPASADLPLALIGAVATDPRWRSRGLASRLVEAALEWAQTRGAHVALLWGLADEPLYAKLGFELRGEQIRIPLSALDLGPVPDSVAAGWTDGIFKLLQGRSVGLRLEAADLPWMRAHQEVRWFYVGPPEAPRACIAYGRGIDLGGFVHEWAGEEALVRSLLAALHECEPDAQLLATPGILPEFARASPGAVEREPLCFAKALAGEIPRVLDLWGLDAV